MDPTPYEPGDIVQRRYVVQSRHQGCLGVVYVVRRIEPSGGGTHVALKTFRFNDDLHRRLFERELTHWVRLRSHPNVVSAIDADPDAKLLTLEFVAGPSLRDVAKQSPLHPRHFLDWARQIAAGLRFLHAEEHFIHRDVRPANVLIDIPLGLVAKISDLGIGKPFDPDETSHTMIGTFSYMAPEVFAGKTDYRSDIFGYGATLYYMLTGENAVKHSTREFERAAPIGGVPEAVSALVMGCLERDPANRFESLDEVLAALVEIRPWKVSAGEFTRCPRHRFDRSVRSGDTRCPFCVWEGEFRAREEALDRRLAKGGERRP